MSEGRNTESLVSDLRETPSEARCDQCGGLLTWVHDHKPDNTGLDDGICYLPGRQPRKNPAPKPADEIRDIRARAWATRRQKYGQGGHR